MVAADVSDMETAISQLMDAVQSLNRWVDGYPEYDQMVI